MMKVFLYVQLLSSEYYCLFRKLLKLNLLLCKIRHIARLVMCLQSVDGSGELGNRSKAEIQ